MGIEDISKKAQDLLNDNKVQDALKSDQAEQISDKALDGASGLANKLTGNKFADHVEGVRSEADKKIGTE